MGKIVFQKRAIGFNLCSESYCIFWTWWYHMRAWCKGCPNWNLCLWWTQEWWQVTTQLFFFFFGGRWWWRTHVSSCWVSDSVEVQQAGVRHSPDLERPLTRPHPPLRPPASGLVPTAEPQWGVLLLGNNMAVSNLDCDHFYGRMYLI